MHAGIEEVVRNVKWGAARGTAVAAMYCLWATVLYALRGTEPFDRHGLGFGLVLATYLTVGVAAGGIVGLMRPFATRRIGAYVAGLVAGLPIALGITVAIKGLPKQWDYVVWFGFPLFWLAVAGVVGHELRRNSTGATPGAD